MANDYFPILASEIREVNCSFSVPCLPRCDLLLNLWATVEEGRDRGRRKRPKEGRRPRERGARPRPRPMVGKRERGGEPRFGKKVRPNVMG